MPTEQSTAPSPQNNPSAVDPQPPSLPVVEGSSHLPPTDSGTSDLGHDPLDISEEQRELIQTFSSALDNISLQCCDSCHTEWYDLDVRDGKCKRCRLSAKYTATNAMDPGPDLATLCRRDGLPVPEPPSQVEEMLLSKVHVQMQIWRVGGAQTKYAGHTCLLPRDNIALVNRLPLLPQDLDVLVIRAKDVNGDAIASRPDFTVRRQRVLDNLNALRHYHPKYRTVDIDFDALSQLPEEGSVYHALRAVDILDEAQPNAQETEPAQEEHLPTADMVSEAMIPNLAPDESELVLMRNELGPAFAPGSAPTPEAGPPRDDHHEILTAPLYHATPINEHDRNHEYLSQAFPFLYPQGLADIHTPRNIPIKDKDYFRHMMIYKGGRFARHPRFRWV